MSAPNSLPQVLPTRFDEANLSKYIIHRKLLYDFNKCVLLSPQIASHFIVKIRAATLNDYIFSPAFRDSAIIVEVVIGRTACALTSCLPSYPSGKKCHPSDSVKIFKSGDDPIIACNPGCFNLYPTPQNDGIQAPLLSYNNRLNSCVFENLGYNLWGTDPTYRAEGEAINITNISTGFNEGDEYVNEKGYGIKMFEINKDYCNHFNKEFITNPTPKCETSTTEDVAGFIIGDYIYQMLGFGVEWTTDTLGITPPKIPSGQPPKVENIPLALRDVSAWQANVRPQTFLFDVGLKLSQLGINSKTRHMTWTNEFVSTGSLVEPLLIYTEIPDVGFQQSTERFAPTSRQINYSKFTNYKDKSVPNEFKIHDTGFHIEPYPTPNFAKDLSQHLEESQQSIEMAIIESIFSFDTAKQLYLGLVFDDFLDLTRRTLIKMMKRVTPIVFGVFDRAAIAITSKIAISITRTITVHLITREIASIATKALLTIGKLAVYSLNVASWIFLVSNIADIVFTIFDPFNLNNRLNPDALLALAKASLEDNRKKFGSPNRVFGLQEMLSLLESNTDQSAINKIIQSTLLKYNTSILPFAYKHSSFPSEAEILIIESANFMTSFEFNSNGDGYNWGQDQEPLVIQQSLDYANKQFNDLYLDTFNFNFHFRNRINHQTEMTKYSTIGLVTTSVVGIFLPPLMTLLFIILLSFLIIYLNTIMFQENDYITKISNLQYIFLNHFIKD